MSLNKKEADELLSIVIDEMTETIPCFYPKISSHWSESDIIKLVDAYTIKVKNMYVQTHKKVV